MKQGHVVIVGGGVVGMNAAKVACGLGAKVTVLDINPQRLSYISDVLGPQCQVLISHAGSLLEMVPTADLLISGVLVAGAKSPVLVTREMIVQMKQGSVVIDIAIDQGGSVETIRATTHADPIYDVEGVMHYGVTNIPGSVPMTSTYALTNVTLFYALTIANLGLTRALADNAVIRAGLNTYGGAITHRAVAESLEMPYAEDICITS